MVLFVLRIDAGRRGEEEARGSILPAGLEHVRVDEDVVARNVSVIRRDVADPAHVGRKVVDLVDRPASPSGSLAKAGGQAVAKSSAALGSNSGALISTPRTQNPSDFRRRTRWWPMNPPAPVTKMRGFPFTQTPGISDWDGEALFYRTLSSSGKLTLGFEKGKEKSADAQTNVQKRSPVC